MKEQTARPSGTDRLRAVRPELLRLLELLPPAKQMEVLEFARFLHQQASTLEPPCAGMQVRTAPAATLVGLTDLVALGGDAVTDTEALYDGDAREH